MHPTHPIHQDQNIFPALPAIIFNAKSNNKLLLKHELKSTRLQVPLFILNCLMLKILPPKCGNSRKGSYHKRWACDNDARNNTIKVQNRGSFLVHLHFIGITVCILSSAHGFISHGGLMYERFASKITESILFTVFCVFKK